MTKEEHAGKIVTQISEYCLCQRVKPICDPKSVEALFARHRRRFDEAGTYFENSFVQRTEE